ncbi:MAG: biopolymer transporter ExbD [Rhodobacteraceae bacterium]|nr:biopolymer transporter ExbD [Paracoccaceae bacterium]
MEAEFDTPRRLSRPRRRTRISLTPLIDVVFILLVFFMLASSFLDWRSISLTSTAAASSGGGAEGALLVDVGPETVRLAGEALSSPELTARIGKVLAAKPEQRVLLRPRGGVDMQRLVTVLDRLRALGAQDIALMPDGRL